MNFGDVLIAGCGGTGTEVAKLLVHAKFSSITFIDCDKIEKTNLNRQYFYCHNDVGEYKAKVLCHKISKLYKQNVNESNLKIKNSISYKIELKKDKKNITDLIDDTNTKIDKHKQSITYIQDNDECKVFNYEICKIENLQVTTYDTIFCCLDNISSRMTVNLFNFKHLIDLGVEGNKCHAKKVIKNTEISCLYCIKELYAKDDNFYVCTQRDVNKLTDRNEILKFLVTKYRVISKVMQEFDKIRIIRKYKKTSIMEIEGIIKNIIPSTCYINSLCASLAFLILKKQSVDFVFYNGFTFVETVTNKDHNCIVCKDKAL